MIGHIEGQGIPQHVEQVKAAPTEQVMAGGPMVERRGVTRIPDLSSEGVTNPHGEIPPTIIYRVQAGDTLLEIANKFGVSLHDLMQWNGITNPNLIYVGQKLRVSGPPIDLTGGTGNPKGGAVEQRPKEEFDPEGGGGTDDLGNFSTNQPRGGNSGIPLPGREQNPARAQEIARRIIETLIFRAMNSIDNIVFNERMTNSQKRVAINNIIQATIRNMRELPYANERVVRTAEEFLKGYLGFYPPHSKN